MRFMEMLKVELNGTEKEYPYGTSLLEIAGEHQDKYENDILLALLNNRLVELNKPLRESGTLTFLTCAKQHGSHRCGHTGADGVHRR